MLALMGYLVEVEDNRAKLDANTQIEIMFKILFKDFVGFKVAHNLGNKQLNLAQQMRELVTPKTQKPSSVGFRCHAYSFISVHL